MYVIICKKMKLANLLLIKTAASTVQPKSKLVNLKHYLLYLKPLFAIGGDP